MCHALFVSMVLIGVFEFFGVRASIARASVIYTINHPMASLLTWHLSGSDCVCRDCDYKHKSDGCVAKITGWCAMPKRQGDGFCDDNNNIAGCAWCVRVDVQAIVLIIWGYWY